MKDIIKDDIYRYYGDRYSIKDKLFKIPELKFIIIMRKATNSKGILKIYYKLKLKRLSYKTQIQIPAGTKI